MMLTIFCLMLFVTGLSTEAWDSLKEREDFLAGKAPFFELPCMRVGGTCAKINACPPGTKVAQRGLCPEQQKYGMECCRPLSTVEIKTGIKLAAYLERSIIIRKQDEALEEDALRIRKKLMNHLLENPCRHPKNTFEAYQQFIVSSLSLNFKPQQMQF